MMPLGIIIFWPATGLATFHQSGKNSFVSFLLYLNLPLLYFGVFNFFPVDKFLDWSKLKAVTDKKINVT